MKASKIKLGKYTHHYGLTSAKMGIDSVTDETVFRVTHTGNMRDRFSDVLENVRAMFEYDDTVEFDIRNEKGHPDYMYTADFYFAKG